MANRRDTTLETPPTTTKSSTPATTGPGNTAPPGAQSQGQVHICKAYPGQILFKEVI